MKEICSAASPLESMNYRLWPFWVQSHELAKITNSIVLAEQTHRGQVRKYNGHPYVTHPLRVGFAASSYPTIKIPGVCAAILHDTLEDTDVKEEEIVQAAGEGVLKLVKELTNTTKDLRKIPRRDRKRMDWERLSKVSFWAKIIKMFDRIDNLRDMLNAPVDFKKLYSAESLELLKVIGDADNQLAAQVESAAKAFYDWRDIPVSEFLNKPNGTEIESAKHGMGVVRSLEKDGEYVKMLVFEGIKFRIGESQDNDFRLMRETGEVK